jgi:Arc/MetJ-type ribon-helix-helix transcriptional regulator
MMCCNSGRNEGSSVDIWSLIREKLHAKGINLDTICSGDLGNLGAKVVCVASDLRESVEEMSQISRGETVMVRIDLGTSKALDEWVETGYVKSRSEAAALFIREGLKVRAQELDKLRDALREVEEAKRNLRDRAEQIFGESKGL